ncbi:MAG: hypothetical protein JXA89_13230 [Anaerolineae bacterium]|nr:hypothetical protein [Anaerolineae bacterium]
MVESDAGKTLDRFVALRQATLDDVAQLAQMRWDFRMEDAEYEFLLTWPSEASTRFYERAGSERKNDSLECEWRPYVP